MKKDDIDRMNRMRWYHQIDLGNGIITPGNKWDHLWTPLKEEMRKVDFSGKSVLDIGCWDGLWSFEAERMGANKVWATDILDQRPFSEKGFETLKFAKEQLKSKIRFKETSVYDLEDHFKQEFDIVIFFGILYHLRYPELGIAKIRNVLKEGGLLLMETAVLLDTKDTIIQTDVGKIYPNDRSTWNAFSMPALISLVHDSYLQPEEYKVILRQDEERKVGRGFVRARAFSGKHQHFYFPDVFLKKHFVPLA